MNSVDRKRVQRDAENGDASAQRLLALVDALAQAIAITEGVGTARAMLGEHDDVYGETIDEMMGVIAPAIKAALDCQTNDECVEQVGFYLPGGTGDSERQESEGNA